MGARESLQRLADKKIAEIADLERQVENARIYLQAIQDSIRVLPRESNPSPETTTEEATIRPGTLLFKAREAIQNKGKPMHITDILQAIGVENTKKARVSLVGSLGTYVRRDSIFSRPAPNTFGLIGMEVVSIDDSRQREDKGELRVQLPDEFGT
jgi:hypothetical protein